MSAGESPAASRSRETLRVVLVVFLLTFIAARITVYLIMARLIPDLYMHAGGTHVHHLNYGIFLLSGVGLYLLVRRPAGRALTRAAVVYGVGLALTFDEFGMWFHLGGGYWQRASFDMMVVIAACFGTIVYAPSLGRFKPRHWITASLLAVAVVSFVALFVKSLSWADRDFGPGLERLEQGSPR